MATKQSSAREARQLKSPELAAASALLARLRNDAGGHFVARPPS
jgi:hypothetical protein